jgi:hypothetical protein
VVLDADLQDPPEIIPEFLEKWEAGYDVVYAIRRKRKEGLFKRAAYFCYYRCLKMLSEISIPLDSGDFCVMDRRVVQALLSCNEQEPFIRGLRAWVGFNQTGLAYERAGRAAGEVKYTFSKLVKLGLNGIFSFSTKPLKLATWMGIACSSLAFVGILFVLVRYLFAEQLKPLGVQPVPGYASIIIAVLFLGGLQLVSLGIVGAYIGRIFQEVKRPPAHLHLGKCWRTGSGITRDEAVSESSPGSVVTSLTLQSVARSLQSAIPPRHLLEHREGLVRDYARHHVPRYQLTAQPWLPAHRRPHLRPRHTNRVVPPVCLLLSGTLQDRVCLSHNPPWPR